MTQPIVVCALALFVAVGCFCRPQDNGGKADGSVSQPRGINAAPTTPTNRTSRLQKPTQVLNTGFDEIVVESNLQVHNRVGSKNKSKIVLPSNSTAAASTNKSARSLLV